MNITNLKLNYQSEPLGIDERVPCFSWNIETKKKNWIQAAYQIRVAMSLDDMEKGCYLYDTKQVMDRCMINIPYQGPCLVSDTDYYWRVTVWDAGTLTQTESQITKFRTGLFESADWKGKWIGEMKDHTNHIFRKLFQLDKKVERASLYVCGLGHFECELNGIKVGNQVLEPGWTNYDKSCLYSSYDITNQLNEGNNAIGIMLGDGMFNVPGGRYVYFERSYGKMKLLVQMNIVYADGTSTWLATDESWRMADSPITFNCIYGGEDYDARLEQGDYSCAEFIENETWKPVVIVDPPKGELKSQSIPPTKVMKTYQPVEVTETKPGVYLYDFGVNFSGWVRIHIKSRGNQSGSAITMVPGEILDETLAPNQRVTGKGYQWKYIMNSKDEQTYAPKFTYTGFRYLQVEGAIPGKHSLSNLELPIIEYIAGEFIYPDMGAMGEFRCSNELFNKIHQIIVQAMLSNIKSIMTDCPHREKLPWVEQTYLIGPGIMDNFEVHNLYRKIEQDMAEAQHDTGLVPDICPEYVVFGYHKGFIDSPEWGSACIINPWHIYKRYGDTSMFAQYYDVMKRYLDYLTSCTHHHILHHGLGDWLDIGPCKPHSQNTPVPVIATAIYYYDLYIMEQISTLLGKQTEEAAYRKLREQVYEEYNLQFYDDQTYRYATGSQAAQAMSLVVGLVPKELEEKVLAYLVKDITLRGYATTAGDIGHPFVIAALMKYGRSDIINQMTNITDKPGYGYQVRNGATTLTEEWDGPELKSPHGSQNHFMLGGIEEWFFNGLAGICSLRTDAPFDEILVKPHFAKECDEVRACIQHPYGRVEIHWTMQEDMVLLELLIPANTTARIVCELDGSERVVGSGYHEFEFSANT